MRAILRDYKGDVIMVASMLEKEVSNPKSIESLAIFRGLQLSIHLGISNLIIKSDC